MKKNTAIWIGVGVAVLGVGFGVYQFLQRTKSNAPDLDDLLAEEANQKPKPKPNSILNIDPTPEPAPAPKTKSYDQCAREVDRNMTLGAFPALSFVRKQVRSSMIANCMKQKA